MSKRYPATGLPDSSASERIEQRLYDAYGGKAPPFPWRNDGEFAGCHAPLLYSKGMIDPAMDAAAALMRSDTLDPRLRELAVLALCSVWDVPYMQYCHTLRAADVGLSHEQVMMAVDSQKPLGLKRA